MGLNPGFAVDLQTGWDLDDPNHSRLRSWTKLIEDQDPFLLTGSPRCDPFSILRSLNRDYINTPKNVEARKRGVRHLHVCVERYRKRHEQGKYFLHEHPATADSWDDSTVRALQALEGVYTVTGPMCAWGMKLSTKK